MNRNRPVILPILVIALVLSGCGSSEKTGSNNVGATSPSNDNAASRVPAADSGANVAPAKEDPTVAPSVPAAGGGGGAQQVASQGSSTRGVSNAPSANMPKPQIGSGGNDFYLFTQARGALNTDAGLKSANVVVDVKEGVVTLTGTVASAEQKSKAEQLVRSVGSKTVKNQLRISAGK